ncbi:MAG: MBOAT family protein [Planctomycetaceae bacterium]
MLFSSPVFLYGFLPVLLALYFICPRAQRNLVLLAFSLCFYAWGEVILVGLMLVSIWMNYVFALWVDQYRGQPRSKLIISLAVAANLGLLGYFKYSPFLVDNVNALLAWAQTIGLLHERYEVVWPEVRLPIGISFYTFQAMSYVFDVYRGHVRVERSPIRVALYISLFPQLIAGPIVRYINVAREMHVRRTTMDGFAYGIDRFIIGLGKKMLIANSAGAVADSVFAIPHGQLATSVAWLGIVCYTLQIYYDFSGYSDMAIGLGRMFGFRFLENFNYPYVSRSVTEFWRRWHISLSTWFRDYVYFPLGGSRFGPRRTALNLLIVFFLCGLWHGASWNFVIWGLFHGTFLMLERQGFLNAVDRLWRPLQHAYVMLVVMAGWVLFRAPTLGGALEFGETLLGVTNASSREYPLAMFLDSSLAVVLAVGCIGSFPFVPAVRRWMESFADRSTSNPAASVFDGVVQFSRVALLMLVLLASSAEMMVGTYNPFIYFRF